MPPPDTTADTNCTVGPYAQLVMNKRLILLAVVFGLAVSHLVARQAGPARLALEAARRVEVVDRDLNGAIVRYREVVSNFPSDRGVVAEALLGLGGCLEQLGQPEARTTYERLIKDYPDS